MAEQSNTTRWSKTAVTNVGTSLLTEFAAGRLLTITSAFGSISASGDNLAELTELPDGRKHPLTIESVTKTDESVTVCIQVSSLGNPEAYKLERIGIFAAAGGSDGSDVLDGNEKLLMVIEDEEDENGGKGVTVPAETEQLYVFKLYAVLTVTNKERLEVSVSSAGIATLGAVEDILKAHNEDPNAHPELAGKSVDDHNSDPQAHPGMVARMRGVEAAINGSETLTGDSDPTAETEGERGQHYINLSTGAEFVCNDVTEAGCTWGPVDSKKSLREFLNETASTAALAKEVADGAAQAIAAVQNTISVVPSQSGTLTYNKGTQKPIWNNYATAMMDIFYGEDRVPEEEFQGETNAETYKAYAKPKEGFTWGDKSSEEKELLWSIQRATISTTPSASGKLVYNGSAQSPDWLNYDPEQLTKTETEQTDAGQYPTAFTPTTNHQWPGGDTSARVVQWSIEKAENTFSIVPSGAQSIEVGDSMAIRVTSNSDAIISAESNNTVYATASVDVDKKTVTLTGVGQGASIVTISSKGSANYTDASATINVSVSRKTPSFSISPAGNKELTIGKSAQITVTTNSDGIVSASSSAPGVVTASANGKNVVISGASAGSATITISVQQTTKYNAASATVNVAVAKPSVANSTWDDISAISNAGTAASYFAVGDTKSITIHGKVGLFPFNNFTVDAFIIGINHNASREGNNRIHWLIGKISGTQVALCSGYDGSYVEGQKYFNMNHWGNANYGGWKGCDLRYDILGSTNVQPSGYGSAAASGRKGFDPSSYDIVNNPVANTLMAALPQGLRKIMKPVTKYTDNVAGNTGDTASNVTASSDYIFLLSEHEVYATRSYANNYESNYQAQYDYFKAGNSKQLYKHDARITAVWGRLRSPYCDDFHTFSAVGSGAGGGVTHYTANASGGLCPGFLT